MITDVTAFCLRLSVFANGDAIGNDIMETTLFMLQIVCLTIPAPWCERADLNRPLFNASYYIFL